MLDLSLGECNFPVSQRVMSAIAKDAVSVNLYPRYDGIYALLEKLLGYGRDHILIGNGSNDIITQLSHDLLKAGDKVVTVRPDFPMYETQAKRNGCQVEEADCFDGSFNFDSKRILEACDGASMLWLSNPNNPTGGVVPKKALEDVIKGAGCKVCVDECYYNYLGETVLGMVAKRDNLIVLRSLSKTYGLAGLRFGFAVGNPSLLERTKCYYKFEVNRIACAAAMAALEDEKYYGEMREKIAGEREFLAEQLKLAGAEVLESKTTFVCARVGDGEGVRRSLEKNSVLVKVAYDMPEWIRVGVGTREMNEEFLRVFNKVFKGAKKTRR